MIFVVSMLPLTILRDFDDKNVVDLTLLSGHSDVAIYAKFLFGRKAEMCQRASVFSCSSAVPSHKALTHQEIEASVIYRYGVEMQKRVNASVLTRSRQQLTRLPEKQLLEKERHFW